MGCIAQSERDKLYTMLPERTPIDSLINFEAIIRHFWKRAVAEVKWDHAHLDKKALDALREENTPNRRDAVREWLQAYRVFRVRGIATQRNEIVDAILGWADSKGRERDLDSPEALSAAHRELMKAVCEAYTHNSQNRPREFTSLASKALWLCYPDTVPVFDSYAQRALWVMAKLETGIAAPPSGPDYDQFVSVWKQFYRKFLTTTSNLDTDDCPHRVRVFDRILWLIGKDQYTVPA
jgi:hypothetical protein